MFDPDGDGRVDDHDHDDSANFHSGDGAYNLMPTIVARIARSLIRARARTEIYPGNL